MSKKITLLIVFLAATVLISGCIDEKKNGNVSEPVKSDIIPQTNLPSGLTFMAIHETYVDIGNTSKKATEGFYRTGEGEDIYIQVFQSASPEELLTEYRSQYKDLKYDPFTEITINDHKAIKATLYSTRNGNEIPRYSIIWTTKNAMIKVSSSTSEQKVIDLATATKN